MERFWGEGMAQVGSVPIGGPMLLFAVLAAVAVASGVGVVAFNNPVRSALCLIANFLSLALLYFTLGAEMLGIVQVVVYTGAIMVLFLFVLMLLNLAAPGALRESRDLRRLGAGGLAAALFVMVVAQAVLPLQEAVQPQAHDAYGTPMALGRALFTEYVWPFELTSVLLLVGIVGSILLAKRRV
ncbi:MAG: NADH-quinone oxidoreductase subunit J [Fimbriimonadales bacterium]